jgi:hypothetical protein
VIRVNIKEHCYLAYWNAKRALHVERLETPRQYGIRWQNTYHCRIDGEYLVFERDEDYTAFMLKWS